MATDLTPFLPITADPPALSFQGMFGRTLTAEESMLALLLVQAAALWIRNAIEEAGKDPLALTDPMAQLVTYMVVRDALAVPMNLSGYTSYQRASDDRSEGGTLAEAGNMLDFTEHHRKMLGLTGVAEPQFQCEGYPLPLQGIRYQPAPGGVEVLGEVAIGENWGGV